MSEPPAQFTAWVQDAMRSSLPAATQNQSLEWQRLSGDAGFRQYFRLRSEPAALAVLSPPATENNEAFVAIANYLREHGVRAPAVLAADLERGYLLVEDLGPDLLLDHITPESVDALYGESLMALLRLQQLAPRPEIFPAYTREKLRTEMNLFSEWFVQQLLGYSMSGAEQGLASALFEQLEQSACEQPQVITHRDFHSRNLIYTRAGSPGVIDFQDAVTGPITYDLVSLLRDCYVQWPAPQVERWALAYAGMAADVGLMQDVPEEQFLRWFDWMGLQRHIKVLGVFARLSLRDGKHGYLKDLPRVVDYTRSVAANYPAAQPFAQWFEETLMPLVQQQQWFLTTPAES